MLEALLVAAVAVLAAGAIRRHGWITRVRSWSMYPGLRPGDLVVTRAVRHAGDLRRGDVVVIEGIEPGRRLVKRIVGLPGETVQVTADSVTVDGRLLAEPYPRLPGGRTGTFLVPDGSYFVLGDNRRGSRDSRSWEPPYPPAGAIRGRLTGRRLPAVRRPTPSRCPGR